MCPRKPSSLVGRLRRKEAAEEGERSGISAIFRDFGESSGMLIPVRMACDGCLEPALSKAAAWIVTHRRTHHHHKQSG